MWRSIGFRTTDSEDILRVAAALVLLILAIVVAGCSAGPDASDTTFDNTATATADEATAFLDQWVTDWNNANLEDLSGVFLPDGVFKPPGESNLVGEEVADYFKFFPLVWSMERTGDAVDNGDGSYSFKIEWTSEKPHTNKRVLAITLEGDKLIKIIATVDD